MSKPTDTSRRNFLKAGALAAVPAAAGALPVAALADDGSKAALARLQDERVLEALTSDFLHAFNAGGAQGTARLFANGKAPALAASINKLARDDDAANLIMADDGASATARMGCKVDTIEVLEGEETIVRMARLQGNAASVRTVRKTLVAQFTRQGEGWVFTSVSLA